MPTDDPPTKLKASKLATSSVFSQYKAAAPASLAQPQARAATADEEAEEERPMAPSWDADAAGFSPAERPTARSEGADAGDEWAAATREHEARLVDAAAAPPAPPSEPITFAAAFTALRADEAAWRPRLPEIKRVADHIKEQSALWRCLWGCMHTEIGDGTPDGDDRDFVLSLALTPFDPTSPVQRRVLLTIHRRLTKPRRSEPDVPLVGPHWEPLGFQGMNPATDLRTNGVWGLLQLLYLVEYFPPFTTALWAASQSPLAQFPFALLSLAFTGIGLEALRDKALHDDIAVRRKKLAAQGESAPTTAPPPTRVEGRGDGRRAVGSMAGGFQREDIASPVAESMSAFYVGCLLSFLEIWRERDIRPITDLPPIQQRLRAFARDNAAKMIKRSADASKRDVVSRLGRKDAGPPGGEGKGGSGEKLEFHTF